MRMYDLIRKKRDGEALLTDELHWMITAYVEGSIPDYQMSAMLMAIVWRGMDDRELTDLTEAMAGSGEMVDLSAIEGIKVDKHSTGGVGDKTTLIACPLAAACGVKIAKMSGRGLGHTGGTIDKLEAIPGYKTNLTREEFFHTVETCGISVVGQSGNLTPADKKLYALRDVTATVESIPLIASSIMSKKLAAGSDGILLDVKTGSGAFMKTAEEAKALGEKMIAIGKRAGRNVHVVISDMDVPLGNCIGNSLEVWEAIETLQGRGPRDLQELCIQLAARMLLLADKGDMETCLSQVGQALDSGAGLEVLKKMAGGQGGDTSVFTAPEKLRSAAFRKEVRAGRVGYICHMNTRDLGDAACMLGAGRERADSPIDYLAGIELVKKTGDRINKGDILCVLYASDPALFSEAEKRFLHGLTIGEEKPELPPLIAGELN